MTDSDIRKEIKDSLDELQSDGEIHLWEKHHNRDLYFIRENEGDSGMIMTIPKVRDYLIMMS